MLSYVPSKILNFWDQMVDYSSENFREYAQRVQNKSYQVSGSNNVWFSHENFLKFGCGKRVKKDTKSRLVLRSIEIEF